MFRSFTPEQIPDVILKGTVADFVEAVGKKLEIRAQFEELCDLGPKTAQRFWVDRKIAEHQRASEDKVHSDLKAKLDNSLIELALDANRRLARSDSNYRIRQGSLLVAPGDDFVRLAMRPIDEIRNDFPSVFAIYEALRNTGSIVSQKEHVGSKFFRSSDRKSDVFDWWHLLGAAYCDVFVCDSHTSKCLGAVRENLGLSKEIVYHSDLSRFVRELRDALHL
jgi:hypothetical protein